MTEHNMRHLEHLQAVADETVRVLREKEATYRGSWKRRGGVGAFMMLARKWDRIETILTADNIMYDIFKAIAMSAGGVDGSVLAEVRDLRGYLTHVEAEMMARGVVEVPRPDHIVETRLSGKSMLERGDEIELDFYNLKAQEWACEVKEAAEAVSLALSPVMAQMQTRRGYPREPDVEVDMRPDGARPEGMRSGTPDDGGQHAAARPWVAPAAGMQAYPSLVRAAYVRRGENLFLEPMLDNAGLFAVQMSMMGASLIATLYEELAPGVHVLRIEQAPAEWRESWPILRYELNATEWAAVPEWQQLMYEWIEPETKYRLRPERASWLQERG